jgi:hypothetical protein
MTGSAGGDKVKVIPDAAALRALRSFRLEAPTGCHISTYSIASHGYAQIGWSIPGEGRKNDMTTAHRAAWTAVYGQIPAGMTIDHMCKNRRCVNVQHLRMLTNFENARRTSGRDWPLGTCINGHGNEYLRRESGRWQCSICAREYQQRYRAKQLTNGDAEGVAS